MRGHGFKITLNAHRENMKQLQYTDNTLLHEIFRIINEWRYKEL